MSHLLFFPNKFRATIELNLMSKSRDCQCDMWVMWCFFQDKKWRRCRICCALRRLFLVTFIASFVTINLLTDLWLKDSSTRRGLAWYILLLYYIYVKFHFQQDVSEIHCFSSVPQHVIYMLIKEVKNYLHHCIVGKTS